MKKIVSVVLAVLVVFSMFTFIATAADTVSVTASADKTAVKVGDEVTVTVNLSKNSSLGGLDLFLKYDKEVFEYVSHTQGADVPGEPMFNPNASKGFRFIYTLATKFNDNIGELFTIKFKAKAAGEATFAIEVVEAYFAVYEESTGQYTGTEATTPNVNSVKVTVEEAAVEPPVEHTHKYSKPVVTKEPTCTAAGEQQATCDCGEKVVESIPATGHAYGKWTVTKPATTTATGEKQKKCANCGDVKKATIAKLPADSSVPSIPNTDAIA